jgi:hypothetical protein
VPRIGFYSNNISLFEFQVIVVVVISFSGVFELHLDKVSATGVTWYAS